MNNTIVKGAMRRVIPVQIRKSQERLKTMAKRIVLPLILFLVAAPQLLFAGPFQVIKVYDGDTIKARQDGTEIIIRLVGVDAPEISGDPNFPGQPYAREAKEFLEGLILKKAVQVKGYGYLKYNILMGEIFLGPENINLDMVRAGFGQVSKGEDPPADLDLAPYHEEEKAARSAKRGIWGQGKRYISPKAWRKKLSSKSGAAVLLYGILQQSEK